jgi:predicted dehydrogenase
MLKVGLIGAGWVTLYHLHAWRAQSDVAAVVAIADPSLENAQRRADEFGIPACFGSARDMLEKGRIDAVDIAAPRAVHAELVRLAADYRLPILCQKPLAPTLLEAERLVADVAGRTRLMVHENWRSRAHYRQAAAWIGEGRIGAVKAAWLTLITSRLLPDANGRLPALDRQPFIGSLSRMLVAEVIIHHLDTLRMLLGPLEVCAAALSRTCPDIAGEDSAVIHLRMANGGAVALFASFTAHGAPAVQTDELMILGDSGTIRFDGTELAIHGAYEQRLSYDPIQTYQGSYDATIAHFVSSLRDGTPFETSPEDNLETLRLVEECYRLSGWESKEADAL